MEDNPKFKHCLNCGTRLIGNYCHECEQHASAKLQNSIEIQAIFIALGILSSFLLSRRVQHTF